jgi:hypothetical protein
MAAVQPRSVREKMIFIPNGPWLRASVTTSDDEPTIAVVEQLYEPRRRAGTLRRHRSHALFRHVPVVALQPVPKAVITEIVDQSYLPLVTAL